MRRRLGPARLRRLVGGRSSRGSEGAVIKWGRGSQRKCPHQPRTNTRLGELTRRTKMEEMTMDSCKEKRFSCGIAVAAAAGLLVGMMSSASVAADYNFGIIQAVVNPYYAT